MVATSASRTGIATSLATVKTPSDLRPSEGECLLLTEAKAARVLSIGTRTLQELRKSGQIRFVRVGTNGVRYYLPALKEWIEKVLQHEHSENGSYGHADN